MKAVPDSSAAIPHATGTISSFEAAELAIADAQGQSSLSVLDFPLQRGLNQTRPPSLLAAHRDMSHGGTFSWSR
jgi:hypothetical protein